MFRRFMRTIFVPALITLIMVGAWFNVLAASPNMVTETTQETIKVAVYGGPGVWDIGRIAIVKMYEWIGASVTVVYASDITGGGLVNYDVLVMPGGNSWDQYVNLGREEGASKIRNFVSNGGGYIGICAGAYYACDYIVWQGSSYGYTIGLFPGHGDGAIDEIASWPNFAMTNISMVNRTHPITESLPDYMWILYYGGPEFHPYAGANVTILGRYQVNGEAAIVACEYGSGKVFLTGPHPEIEEDSDRDGSRWGDALDDKGSDWPLMHAALYWMTASSSPVGGIWIPIDKLGLLVPYICLVSTIVFATLATVIYFKRRREKL